jgi:hypothetical protein
MDKKPLIVVSICAVALLVLASLTNVVGYQSIQLSNQTVINNEVNQKELLFQTIVDIANNKDIQSIILRYQLSQGKLPDTTIPILTTKQLKQMYLVGLVLSKFISKARMHSMIEKYQINNQVMQKEITTVIEKDANINKEIKQLTGLKCGCENENTSFPIICFLLWYFLIFLVFRGIGGKPSPIMYEFIMTMDKILNCPW